MSTAPIPADPRPLTLLPGPPALTAADANAAAPEAPLPDGAIGLAWPTYRPVYPYTRDEIADGVDVYTVALKAAARRDVCRRRQGGGVPR